MIYKLCQGTTFYDFVFANRVPCVAQVDLRLTILLPLPPEW
jgi:hypothetical protein